MTHGIVIDEDASTLHLDRTYRTSPARAWRAWTEPEAITRWWGPHGWVTTVHAMDVRPGGEWRFTITPADGSAEPVRGIATYQRVEPEALLAYVDAFADETWTAVDPTFPTQVSFTAEPGSVRVRVTAAFPDGDALRRAVELGMAQGLSEALARLGDEFRRA